MQMQIAARAVGSLEQMGMKPGMGPAPQAPLATNGNAAAVIGNGKQPIVGVE